MEKAYRLQELAGIVKLPFTTTIFKGVTFKTGLPVEFPFRKNINKTGTKQDINDTFLQSIEPDGNYISFNETDNNTSIDDQSTSSNFGTIKFENPLVIKFNSGEEERYDSNNWKSILKNFFGQKKRALSQKIISNGYDGIVTIYEDGHVAEIVDLTNFK